MIKRTIVTVDVQQIGYAGSVYRFFDEEIHADNFCKGQIRISTLEACRGYENPEQGDKGEASWLQRVDSVYIKDASEKNYDWLSMVGIRVDPSSKYNIIENAQQKTRIPNAYVICTTRNHEPDVFSKSFGKYCVEIFNAHEFCASVAEKIAIHHKGLKVFGKHDDVLYTQRTGLNEQGPSKHIGFIKPEKNYSHQKEFRFLWILEDQSLELDKLDIVCPKVSEMCKRIA